MNQDTFDFVFSILLTWGWGLTVPLILRYGVLKRPLDKTISFFIVCALWLLNIFIFTALGSTSRTHGALYLVAAVSFWILTRNASSSQSTTASPTALDSDSEHTPQLTAVDDSASRSSNLVDNGFKGKRVRIYLNASIISTLISAIFASTSSDWFLAIPVASTVVSVLLMGHPESVRNWRNTVIWSLLLTPPVFLTSFLAFGLVLSAIK